eukprot:scaffold20031_cov28-Prasinocladus_malaysianus.AAC.2
MSRVSTLDCRLPTIRHLPHRLGLDSRHLHILQCRFQLAAENSKSVPNRYKIIRGDFTRIDIQLSSSLGGGG